MDSRRFFVIGFPRSRTAWLSVLLNGDGIRCEHEATNRIHEWTEEIAGTCDSSALLRAADMRAQFPGARWVVIHRDPRDALAAVVADNTAGAPFWIRNWPVVEDAFAAAMKAMPADALHVAFHEVNERAAEIYEFCTGRPAPAGKVEMLRGLRITQIPAPVAPIPGGNVFSCVQKLESLGFDLSGLRVRHFESRSDSVLFLEWASRDAPGEVNPLPLLPPLGVVVTDADGPAVMLFCRESFGVSAADLEFAAARPGMSYAQTSAAMAFAASACMDLAGKCIEPEAEISTFRAVCPPTMGRFLARLGFQAYGRENCRKYLFVKS